jgi:putative nucleotidyltransferase with HDIG domain
MTHREEFSGHAQAFIACVVGAGTIVVFHSLYRVYQTPPDASWLLLAGLAILSGLFTIRVPSIPATISVSETFVFTSVLIFGTPAATLTVALEALIMSSWRHRKEFHKVVFNATEPPLSIWVAATFFFLLVEKPVGNTTPPNIATFLGPMAVLCLTYFVLNSLLTAAAVGLEKRSSILDVWKHHFWWLCLNYFVSASIALIIVQNSTRISVTTVGIILPILAISYLTMRAAMGRIHDAQEHVAETERLYMSTIESLAMAVDAKDQVTHGHIRRVQSLAVGLARGLGLHDATLLKAIEASALLHDMGKLAVPEYILNKPGKLTPAEFERMKLHATIGAEILSSIQFPYPVVPMVRHHHENWDGTGYPDGLSGAAIPIGARILAVVDCFDALTSDRPYRRRLPDEEALSILVGRRGSMYDPWIVDTFVKIYEEIRPVEQSPEAGNAYSAIARAATLQDDIKTGEQDRSGLPAHPLNNRNHELTPALQLCDKYLARLFPDFTCAIYALDSSSEELYAVASIGPRNDLIQELAIPVSRGVSGWVAANRQPAFNSDPVSDFGNTGNRFFKYCVSAPIVTADGNLIGVITVYSEEQPFSLEHFDVLREATTIGLVAIPLISQDKLLLRSH